MSWTDDAAAIWGASWVSPLARVVGCDRRTVQRWKKAAFTGDERNACPEYVIRALHNAALELRGARRP